MDTRPHSPCTKESNKVRSVTNQSNLRSFTVSEPLKQTQSLGHKVPPETHSLLRTTGVAASPTLPAQVKTHSKTKKRNLHRILRPRTSASRIRYSSPNSTTPTAAPLQRSIPRQARQISQESYDRGYSFCYGSLKTASECQCRAMSKRSQSHICQTSCSMYGVVALLHVISIAPCGRLYSTRSFRLQPMLWLGNHHRTSVYIIET
jgi:hypothetical protein